MVPIITNMGKILVIGSSGQLASSIKEIANQELYYFMGRPDIDLTNYNKFKQKVRKLNPSLIINCAAYTNVEAAEIADQQAYNNVVNLNFKLPHELAKISRKYDIPMIHISSDYVFDGDKQRAYTEEDVIRPISFYGTTKALGDIAIKQVAQKFVIIRTSWLFSKYGNNFIYKMLDLAKHNQELTVVNDQIGSPTAAHNLANAITQIAKQITSSPDNFPYGIYNYCDKGYCSWYDFAQNIFEFANTKYNLPRPKIIPISTAEYNFNAKRPLNSRLSCKKITKILGIKQYSRIKYMQEVVESGIKK